MVAKPHQCCGQCQVEDQLVQVFADVATLIAEPDLTEPARRAARTIADHLTDLLRQGQADGDIRADLNPEPGAWLLLWVLSTRPLRAAAMPDRDRIGADVAGLTLQALAPPAPVPPSSGHEDHHQAHRG